MKISTKHVIIVSVIIGILSLIFQLVIGHWYSKYLSFISLMSLFVVVYLVLYETRRARGMARYFFSVLIGWFILIPISLSAYRYIVPDEEEEALKTKIGYKAIDLDEYNYQQADLIDGDKVTLLSVTNGVDCNDKFTYYYSVIALVGRTGEFVRILTPCQQIEDNFKSGTFKKIRWMDDELVELIGVENVDNEIVLINKNVNIQHKDCNTMIGIIEFE